MENSTISDNIREKICEETMAEKFPNLRENFTHLTSSRNF